MSDTVVLWRIATDTPDYTADDLSGEGAYRTGGRWNRAGTAMVYASQSIALACLETVVHLARRTPLPLNRYLVEIRVPRSAFESATSAMPEELVGWDAEPAGRVSLDWGTRWADGDETLLARVPSVIVPEESNLLLNPAHRDAALVRARKIRRWTYDGRLR